MNAELLGLDVPEHRRAGLDAVLNAVGSAQHVVLTTHVNADGDGTGSQAAVAAWLMGRGTDVAIVNPTPFPSLYRYLVTPPDVIVERSEPRVGTVLDQADLFLVLDTSEPGRLGRVGRAFGDRPVVVVDHHPPAEAQLTGEGLRDPTACATGELIYDLLRYADAPEPWPEAIVGGLYVAIVTDTGSFRFANTSPRTHLIAADLLRRGVDPEAVYRHVFASFPLRRIHLLRAALERLEVDPELPLAWITVPHHIMAELGTDYEDLDGVIDYARALRGTELALLFRETSDGATKLSFRSNGRVDVNALARQFGGGGHVRAAGALVHQPIDQARPLILEAARDALRALNDGPHPNT